MSVNREQPTILPDGELDPNRWDWVTVVVTLLIAAVFVLLTFDFWFPH